MTNTPLQVIRDSDGVAKQYERVVFCEILVPDTLNTFYDYHTPEDVKAIAYEFARQGYGVDVNHDQQDISGKKVYIVESFIAREGDPDFIPHSWVVGVKVLDDTLWADILAGRINGFSYEALVLYNDAVFDLPVSSTIQGLTEPDLDDGHVHLFTVVIGSDGRVVAGGTDIVNGHQHAITSHTVTQSSENHVHRYQILEAI